MATKQVITQQVERTVKGNYDQWMIGLTSDPIGKKAALGQPLNWLHWQADSESEAAEIVDDFVRKGMHKDNDGEQVGRYVYILPNKN